MAKMPGVERCSPQAAKKGHVHRMPPRALLTCLHEGCPKCQERAGSPSQCHCAAADLSHCSDAPAAWRWPAGRRYRDDPTIFAWDLINEPRCNCFPKKLPPTSRVGRASRAAAAPECADKHHGARAKTAPMQGWARQPLQESTFQV